MESQNIIPVDLNQIEEDARKARAEAIRASVAWLFGRITAQFGTRSSASHGHA